MKLLEMDEKASGLRILNEKLLEMIERSRSVFTVAERQAFTQLFHLSFIHSSNVVGASLSVFQAAGQKPVNRTVSHNQPSCLNRME